jgi:hypothetical protein
MRVVGGLAVLVGLVLAGLGALWAFLKTVGTEWDYCPGGGDCISGYYAAAALLLAGGIVLWVGIRLVRRNLTRS